MTGSIPKGRRNDFASNFNFPTVCRGISSRHDPSSTRGQRCHFLIQGFTTTLTALIIASDEISKFPSNITFNSRSHASLFNPPTKRSTRAGFNCFGKREFNSKALEQYGFLLPTFEPHQFPKPLQQPLHLLFCGLKALQKGGISTPPTWPSSPSEAPSSIPPRFNFPAATSRLVVAVNFVKYKNHWRGQLRRTIPPGTSPRKTSQTRCGR
jgi:hypothetical protein